MAITPETKLTGAFRILQKLFKEGWDRGGTVPTIAVNANAGTSATASLVAGSQDQQGTITIVQGSAANAAGVQATVTFATSWEQAPNIVLTYNTINTTSPIPSVASVTNKGFDIAFNIAGTASATYKFNYVCFG